MVRVTVEFLVAESVEDPVAYVRGRVLRDTEIAYPEVSIADVFQDDEPEYPDDRSPELHASWREMVEFWAEEGTPSETYPEWIRSQIETYEQIWREAARDRDRDSSEQYLQVLRREEEKLVRP